MAGTCCGSKHGGWLAGAASDPTSGRNGAGLLKAERRIGLRGPRGCPDTRGADRKDLTGVGLLCSLFELSAFGIGRPTFRAP
ncbi:hypothetical protein [Arcanobacterium phocae]|uniref:hypothetical protein n=1 Tax=Arcanobacterium phocae TaxID=131112 RepID=UPI0012F9B19B|nr:hypothetical protein [Arcanobacterium phocae]